MRKAISLEQRVAIALWRLATNDDYRAIDDVVEAHSTEQLLTCLVSPEHLFVLLYGMSVMPLCKCCCQSTFRPLMVSVCKALLMIFLVSGGVPSVLVLLMGPISPSCHPWTARLTIMIRKGSTRSSYKL